MVELVEGLAQSDDDQRVERVLCFRPVDADQQNAAAPLNDYPSRLWRSCCRGLLGGRALGACHYTGCGNRDADGQEITPVYPSIHSHVELPAVRSTI